MAAGGSTAINLPGDAIFDILSWTPVKSLCRFRCVSKEWLALISNPAFVVKHSSRAGPETRLVASFYKGPYGGGILVMDTKGNVTRAIEGLGLLPTVRSSLDNLIAVSCYHSITRVVDVVTGKVLVTFPAPEGAYAMRLGRSAGSRLCKVVRLTEGLSYHGQLLQQTCEVRTLGSVFGWRQAQSPPAIVSLSGFDSFGATVNGVVYFLTSPTHGLPTRRRPGDDRVVCFNLQSEEWNKPIEGPLKADTELWSKTGDIRIAELKEALCMIQTEVRQTDHPCTNVWILVDPDNSIWDKAYVIPKAMSSHVVEPLWMMPDGVVKLLLRESLIANRRAAELRVYDHCSGICTDMMKMPNSTFGKISRCNLHLDNRFAPAARKAI
ncbi:hypothetical protein QYE76_036449 [Lolium multiflorum]|uniref:F-box domain-containing protein n=1 Tax=Lolium multiflorum TaxID=4521 RepID=A0AAD8R2K9_LOLMU|nr:hypothetical protein QYE76_036449 [Lolium multiflorum]